MLLDRCLLSASSVTVYCGQTGAWTKMPLGMEVGLGSGHIVLDGDAAPPQKMGHSSPPPTFRPMSIVIKRRQSQQLLSSCSNRR